MIVWALLLGCAVESNVESTPDEVPPDEPSEYIYDEDSEQTEALLSLGELEEGIREVIDVAMVTDPMDLTVLYDELRIEQDDDDCPYYYVDADGNSYYGYDYWYDTCTSDEGGSFTGYAYSYNYEPYTSGGYVYDDEGYVHMYGSIIDRLGDGLELSGTYYHYTYGSTADDNRHGYGYVLGDARWTGTDMGWLSQEYSLDLYYWWDYYPLTTGYTLNLDGSLSGLQGQVNSALFDDVYIHAETLGSECELEPSGNIAVRDEAGEWYHVYFQGPAWWGAPVFPPDCDGCGEAFYRGDSMGSVCPDFEGLSDWALRPWD